MKKIILFNLIVICIGLSSCKKGEDDPKISLRTRKGRLTGDWKMTAGTLKLWATAPNANYSDIIYDFKEDSYGCNLTGNGGHFDGPSKLQLSIIKDGTFILTQKMDSVSFTASGTWDFQEGVGDDKKKERVSFQLNSLGGASNRLDLFNKSNTFFSYKIKELRNNKIVLESDQELISSETQGFNYYATGEYTFVQ